MENYDYSSNWWYFVTICTKNREHYFWKIKDWKIILNEYGKIVENEIQNMNKNNKQMNIYEFIVMPNHIHLILITNVETSIYRVSNNNKNNDNTTKEKDTINGCLYERWWTLMKDKNVMLNKKTIWFIIRKLKWKITFLVNKLNYVYFAWQPNYYERIIRNKDELQRIQKYIIKNPLKWEEDKENTENLYM